MGIIISVDPAVHTIAIAILNNSKLIACNFTQFNFSLIYSLCASVGLDNIEKIIIEKPQVYEQRFLKGDPNDLIDLAIAIGKLSSNFERRVCKNIIYVLPTTWKGQVKKNIIKNRILKVATNFEKLLIKKACEKIQKSKQHNIFDAIGIGFNHVGRI